MIFYINLKGQDTLYQQLLTTISKCFALQQMANVTTCALNSQQQQRNSPDFLIKLLNLVSG